VRQQIAVAMPLAEFAIVVDRMVVAGRGLEGEECASVTVREGM
jgi:hypothetical protein